MVSFSIGIFLATFIVAIFATRFFKLIFWYGINSFILGVLAILMGLHDKDQAMIISGIVTIFLKALTIPYILKLISKEFNIQRDIEPNIKVHFNVILIPTIIVFTFYLVGPFAHSLGAHANYVAISISALFLSLILMIEHSSVAPKIIGFLMMENSLFLLGVTSTGGMPMFIEIGVFFDLMIAIVVINLLFKEEVAR
ncbi:hydrogenase [Sulfurospirillum sp. 1307]|jgi:hydrogenase-4 component E